MITTIDPAGRVVIPKRIRDHLGLRGGEEIDIDVVGSHIELHRKDVDVVIDQLADGPVLRAVGHAPHLSVADIRRLVDEDRLR